MIPAALSRQRAESQESTQGDARESLIETLAGGDVTKMLSMVRSFLEIERENVRSYSMPWWKRLWCYRHGFYSFSGIIYGLDRHNVDRYLSDLARRKATSINQAHWKVAQLKLAFNQVLSHTHPRLLTDIVATVQDGEVYPLPSSKSTAESVEELVDELPSDSTLVAKPAGGWAGEGIFSLGRLEDGFTLDGEPVPRDAVEAKLGDLDGYLLEQVVTQAAYASEIYPNSTNTIRIVTMIDPDTREPFVAAAVHRFGTDESRPVDNWSAGGVCSDVDIDTGLMGPATAKPKSGSPTFVSDHPDTGAPIDGTVVPSWETIREEVLAVADTYQHLWRYLGWDVVVTDDEGSIAVIEANARPMVDLNQVHEPLLDDARVRRFYRHHGVI